MRLLSRLAALTALIGFAAPLTAQEDLRDAYDVQTYRIDIRVDPATKTVHGTSVIEAKVVVGMDRFVLDLLSDEEGENGKKWLAVEKVQLVEAELGQTSSLAGEELPFQHLNDQVTCVLPEALSAGDTVRVAVTYSGTPGWEDGFTGFHWAETADGSPWINTSCQGTGAHWWFPCKASFFNASDKHEQLFVNATVPEGLYAVSNGRLQSRSVDEGWETFRWHNEYGCETYAITLNVGPYVVVESMIDVPGLTEQIPFIYYVLPENVEKAAVQFAQVPELVRIFSEAFGPFPFPEAKFGLVETNFWGMEHSTAVAYGSSYPAWCKENDAKDRYANRNRYFDYILVHEVAHEWWGNAVSARDWGHFWIHEGFGTYAEGVYVEKTQGREVADKFFSGFTRRINQSSTVYAGANNNSAQAYRAGSIYGKGAAVLNTLRHFVDDDDAWWKTLRDFNLAFRYKNAVTEDFQAILEKNTGRDWDEFFKEWFYGKGYPTLKGSIEARGKTLFVDIDNPADDERSFHVPINLTFKIGDSPTGFRLVLEPGENKKDLDFPGELSELQIDHLDRIAGRHEVEVKSQ